MPYKLPASPLRENKRRKAAGRTREGKW